MPDTLEEIYCMVGEKIKGEGGKTVYKRETALVQTKDPFQVDEDSVAGPLLAKKSQGGKKYEYKQITETEGFILRLALHQLDISLIQDALVKKCSDKLSDVEEQDVRDLVPKVINRYKAQKFIRPMTEDEIKENKIPKNDMLAIQDHPPKLFTKLDLNASINQIGPPIFMISFPPIQ
jgi:hypothetical protein